MEKSYETCAKCKYAYHSHCINVEDCTHCDNVTNDGDDYYCKCLTIHRGEDCPYFMKAEEVDDNDGSSSNG